MVRFQSVRPGFLRAVAPPTQTHPRHTGALEVRQAHLVRALAQVEPGDPSALHGLPTVDHASIVHVQAHAVVRIGGEGVAAAAELHLTPPDSRESVGGEGRIG